MYLMRNENSEEARTTLCQLLSKEYCKTQTSLLKHEICFILGQIGCANAEHLVRECIENEEEEPIVRHEALAAVASQSKDASYLDKFVNHPNGLIRESALVAQYSIHYWND
jgi:deoxyhypusine monooxygenase